PVLLGLVPGRADHAHAELARDVAGLARGGPGDLADDRAQARRHRVGGGLGGPYGVGPDLRHDDAGDDDRRLDEALEKPPDTGAGGLRGHPSRTFRGLWRTGFGCHAVTVP